MRKLKILEPTIEITLNESPEKHNFKRFLTFQTSKGRVVRMPVKFKLKDWLKYKVTVFPEGIEVLEQFLLDGNRSFWDNIYIENRRGQTLLDIRSMLFICHFKGLPSGVKNNIPLIDTEINKILGPGETKIKLNKYIQETQWKQWGIEDTESPLVRAIMKDLGTYGSNMVDESMDNANPKYGANLPFGSSAFAAWYYHELGIKSGDKRFNRLKYKGKLLDFFRETQNLSSYQPSRKRSINLSTKRVAHPECGDIVVPKNQQDKAMIIMGIREDEKRAIVALGPSPVSLLTLNLEKVGELEGFYLGKIDGWSR